MTIDRSDWSFGSYFHKKHYIRCREIEKVQDGKATSFSRCYPLMLFFCFFLSLILFTRRYNPISNELMLIWRKAPEYNLLECIERRHYNSNLSTALGSIRPENGIAWYENLFKKKIIINWQMIFFFIYALFNYNYTSILTTQLPEEPSMCPAHKWPLRIGTDFP